jgi:hypothetical protein
MGAKSLRPIASPNSEVGYTSGTAGRGGSRVGGEKMNKRKTLCGLLVVTCVRLPLGWRSVSNVICVCAVCLSVCLSVCPRSSGRPVSRNFFNEICRRNRLRNLSSKESFGEICWLRVVLRLLACVGLCPRFVAFTGGVGRIVSAVALKHSPVYAKTAII